MIHIDSSLYFRLKNIIESLCKGKGGIKKRFKDCYRELTILQPSDFPTHLQDEWNDILKSLTKYSSKDITKSSSDKFIESLDKEHYESNILGGNFNITLGKIRSETTSKVALKIYNIFWSLHNYYFGEKP